ncbi:MAG: acylphosphatase [Nitrospira sp.]|nr:acylphosphatase [Nitrospira sp.]
MTDPTEPATVRATISVAGRVQGVGYRAFAVRVAAARGLRGTVRNLDDGRVELDVEGPKDRIESLMNDLHTGPPAARVTAVSVEWGRPTGRFSDFRISYAGGS